MAVSKTSQQKTATDQNLRTVQSTNARANSISGRRPLRPVSVSAEIPGNSTRRSADTVIFDNPRPMILGDVTVLKHRIRNRCKCGSFMHLMRLRIRWSYIDFIQCYRCARSEVKEIHVAKRRILHD